MARFECAHRPVEESRWRGHGDGLASYCFRCVSRSARPRCSSGRRRRGESPEGGPVRSASRRAGSRCSNASFHVAPCFRYAPRPAGSRRLRARRGRGRGESPADSVERASRQVGSRCSRPQRGRRRGDRCAVRSFRGACGPMGSRCSSARCGRGQDNLHAAHSFRGASRPVRSRCSNARANSAGPRRRRNPRGELVTTARVQ